jgi:hypothetical protein
MALSAVLPPLGGLPMTHYISHHKAPPSDLNHRTQTEEMQRLIARQHAKHDPFSTRQDANWLLDELVKLAERVPTCGGWPVLGRFGHIGDGGWWVCDSPRLRGSHRGACAIYSAGIGFDWSFDLAAATRLPNCTVHMMDRARGHSLYTQPARSIPSHPSCRATHPRAQSRTTPRRR